MKADLHVHTHISVDSSVTMEEYCRKAIAEGVDFICFTDHADYNQKDDGYGRYDAPLFFEEFNQVKKEFGEQLVLLAGIEFSEPHLYPEELQSISQYPYDMIIGSIHWVNDMFPGQEVRKLYSAKQYYGWYWDMVYETVSYGHFDCLGHMDFPKRYYSELVYDISKLEKILGRMVERGIVPEINTSSLRKGLSAALPDEELLKLYKECGGRRVTIGSDAHVCGDLAAGNAYARDLIRRMGFEEVIFRRRQPVAI
ncbi:histidinol-phosphatase (PHP family) [Anaerotaenia torta]|uniref:histidinol-phosphatase HisJ family protein n=1 Tax=Anaerotaenia torta TaxID=433293 RepID=UPI003D2248DB